MQSKGNKTTAAQKRWMERVSKIGSVVTFTTPVELHHVVGVTGKHNKILIGPWWLLPLTQEEHRLMHESKRHFSIKHFNYEIAGSFKMEKLMFSRVLERITGELPFDDDVVEAIEDYHR